MTKENISLVYTNKGTSIESFGLFVGDNLVTTSNYAEGHGVAALWEVINFLKGRDIDIANEIRYGDSASGDIYRKLSLTPSDDITWR